MSWHPRGEPTWPDWKTAEPGTRVEHVRSGATGTFVRAIILGNSHAVIDWDDTGFGVSRGRVVAPAFDLKVMES